MDRKLRELQRATLLDPTLLTEYLNKSLQAGILTQAHIFDLASFNFKPAQELILSTPDFSERRWPRIAAIGSSENYYTDQRKRSHLTDVGFQPTWFKVSGEEMLWPPIPISVMTWNVIALTACQLAETFWRQPPCLAEHVLKAPFKIDPIIFLVMSDLRRASQLNLTGFKEMIFHPEVSSLAVHGYKTKPIDHPLSISLGCDTLRRWLRRVDDVLFTFSDPQIPSLPDSIRGPLHSLNAAHLDLAKITAGDIIADITGTGAWEHSFHSVLGILGLSRYVMSFEKQNLGEKFNDEIAKNVINYWLYQVIP